MLHTIRALAIATGLAQTDVDVTDLLDQVLAQHRPALVAILVKFFIAEVTPENTFRFERELAEALRKIGRQTVEGVFNALESDQPEQLPHDVHYAGGGYRRLKDKTANRHVATLFGTITLHRHPYRYWQRDAGEPCIFPLEIQLGLRHGVTPALAEAVARYMAQAGATQHAVLERLRSQHGVAMGVQRLRDLTAELSEALAELTPQAQADRLRELLEIAGRSRGNRKPVLAVGRDGITLRNYRYGFFEIATVATLTVYDRAGKRLATVYLSVAPELGQHTLTARLTALIETVLRRWEGPLPRLCYVTDAGDEETKYYYRVLRRMKHPRTGEKLLWTRIIDYYHASSRIWTMAEALFGKDTRRGAGLGVADVPVVEEAQRGAAGVVFGGGVARAAEAEEGAPWRVPEGVPVLAKADAADALPRVPRATPSHRQWCDGSGMQNGGHATAEAFGNAVGKGERSKDSRPARDLAERYLGPDVPEAVNFLTGCKPPNLQAFASLRPAPSRVNTRIRQTATSRRCQCPSKVPTPCLGSSLPVRCDLLGHRVF